MVVLALGMAYFASSFSINNIFLANSPKIRSNLPQYMLAKINNTRENILAKLNFNINFFPSSSQNNTITEKQTIDFLKKSLKPVTKGVSAAYKDAYSYTEFKVDQIEWVKVTYTLKNGKTVTIQYPKGTKPPPKELYERQNE